jgi:hypothetical protein
MSGKEYQRHGIPLRRPDPYDEQIFSIPALGLRYPVPTCLGELNNEANTSKLHDASREAYLTHQILQVFEMPDHTAGALGCLIAAR